MRILTIDGSGEVAEPGTLTPGRRYTLAFATNGSITGGTLGFREISPQSSPIDFFATPGGTTPITWDLSAVESGRMDFTSSTNAYLIYVTGANVGETFEYNVTPIIP